MLEGELRSSTMARKNTYDYKLVDDEASLKDALSELKGRAEHNALLAVDCEGVSLTRKGELTIITVATEEKAYIFDVLKLGKAVFTGGLSEILEDKSCEKLMFDCREDSDALWHQFNVKLTGVLDLQLLEIIYRRETATASRPYSTKYARRSQRTDEVEIIFGFARCLELYVQDQDLIRRKNTGSRLLKYDSRIWKKRPLQDRLLEYCAVDTMGMFKLYDRMKDVKRREEARLRVASERYVDYCRGRAQRYYDTYEKNAYLPLDIIPDKGTLYFSPADTACTSCHRLFPRDEFNTMQGEQKCRVCKEIKRRADERSRRYNWRRFDEVVFDEDGWW